MDQTITFPDTCILEASVRKEKDFARVEQQQGTKGVNWQQPRPKFVLGGGIFFFKISFKLFSHMPEI